jgi:hypothetical protein
MLPGEKLFWNLRAEGFSTQFLLGRTLQTRISQRRKRGRGRRKRPAPEISTGPMHFTKLPVHSPLGSFSSSRLGGAFSFGGLGLGAPALGAFSLGVFSLVAGFGAFSSRGGVAACVLGGGVEGRLAGWGRFGVAGAFPAGAAARASLGDIAGA